MIDATEIPAEQRPVHVLNRLAFGPAPGDLETVKRIGVEHWIAQQLTPESLPEPPVLEEQIASLETLRMTPTELFMRYGAPMMQAAKGDPAALKTAHQESRVVVEEAVELLQLRLEAQAELGDQRE